MSEGSEYPSAAAAASEPRAAERTPAEPGGESAPWRPDGTFRHVDPNYVQVEAIGCWIFTALVMAGALAAVVVVASRGAATGWLLAAAIALAGLLLTLLVWLSLRYPHWEYRHIRYAVDRSGIEIHKGIVWRHKLNVPSSRIQHTDVSQGPLARRFGIANLQVFTAGTRSNQVDLEGLEYDTAVRIRDYLVEGTRADDI